MTIQLDSNALFRKKKRYMRLLTDNTVHRVANIVS